MLWVWGEEERPSMPDHYSQIRRREVVVSKDTVAWDPNGHKDKFTWSLSALK